MLAEQLLYALEIVCNINTTTTFRPWYCTSLTLLLEYIVVPTGDNGEPDAELRRKGFLLYSISPFHWSLYRCEIVRVVKRWKYHATRAQQKEVVIVKR